MNSSTVLRQPSLTASETSSRSSEAGKPTPRPKPHRLRGNSIHRPEQDSLSESSPRGGYLVSSRSQGYSQMAGDRRLVIAIDFGTTYTGVAFATQDLNNDDTEVAIIQDWGPRMQNHDKIPSIISYSRASIDEEQQWGHDLSSDAVAMVNTKLELDVQDNKADELDLMLQVLDGVKDLHFDNVRASGGLPDYTWKCPEEIATDYLRKIFQAVDENEDIRSARSAQITVDIVVTVPVSWSYRAKNSTIRAIQSAGFNKNSFPNLKDMLMVTEPEAAAIFTARALAQEEGQQFLKKGECFVLCDAGGGTVDVVSYKVTELEPLELERVTMPTGAKAGSINIDGNFKRWLNKELGNVHYRKLDPKSVGQRINVHTTEGESMRALMKKFDIQKKSFHKDARDMRLDLPGDLANITINHRVVDGELTITMKEMELFFQPCVDRIIELIEGQIQQIARKNNRVKNILLVGGFAESRYLQEELEFSMKLRKIRLWRPDKSWTAVVRGAVMCGIEKTEQTNITTLQTCQRSYGLTLNHQFQGSKHDRRDHYVDHVTNSAMAKLVLTWLIVKGDLLLSDQPKQVFRDFDFNFRETDRRLWILPIYMYPDDDIPDRYDTAQEELLRVGLLNCDFTKFPIEDFDRVENFKNGRVHYTARCICKAELFKGILKIEITWNDRRICELEILDEERVGDRSSSVSHARSFSDN